MSSPTFLTTANGRIQVLETLARQPSRGTLLCVHGGPNGDYHGNEGIFDELADHPGLDSFDVLQFSMRGYGKSDGTPQDITLFSQVADFRSILSTVTDRNPRSIHVVGESMGATIAALSWDTSVDSYIFLWPAFDLRDTDFSVYFTPEWRAAIDQNGFIEDNGVVIGAEFYNQLLTYDFSDCFHIPNKPTFIAHGKRDVSVPFQQSLRATAEASGPVTLYAHPDAEHGFQRPEERMYIKTALGKWLT
ncbi:alpha/beta hydrolase [Lichenifustis flavocetrariae]|uniref:Alpha/beta fold hydrolase n=1 Tax=Lichenifustis flavocetrariae TaxID=2949735 RepID=A0AA41YZ06_9HYPH|nr:alpha/beta fold hydrolase [Lichenifustis flavocetrariae]MCW6509832.1 alpha/beta fold hydrolase [Lichenifustis flavocetrariae]